MAIITRVIHAQLHATRDAALQCRGYEAISCGTPCRPCDYDLVQLYAFRVAGVGGEHKLVILIALFFLLQKRDGDLLVLNLDLSTYPDTGLILYNFHAVLF